MNPADPKNPSNLPETKNPGKDRVPMSVPVRHLEVADIPGYHLHWFLTSRVPRALRAGYTFVTEEDGVDINNFDLAGDASANGSSDLGSRISVPAAVGGDSEERLFLMKLPQEFWEQDQDALFERNESVARALRGDARGAMLGEANPYDQSQRYIPEGQRQNVTNLFTPKRKR